MHKPSLVIALLLLTGCATDSLYFGAYTRIGIDASADGAGIGAKTAAINITQTAEDGTPFDVLGMSDFDLSHRDAIVREIVATGRAARCAAKTEQPAPEIRDDEEEGEVDEKKQRLYFGSFTSFSLFDLNWGATPTPGITFGYKRAVGVRVPIENDQVGSIYAKVIINTTDNKGDEDDRSKLEHGVRTRHEFATGKAAVIRAGAAKDLSGNAQFKDCDTEP